VILFLIIAFKFFIFANKSAFLLSKDSTTVSFDPTLVIARSLKKLFIFYRFSLCKATKNALKSAVSLYVKCSHEFSPEFSYTIVVLKES
jgi:hypothetical protein